MLQFRAAVTALNGFHFSQEIRGGELFAKRLLDSDSDSTTELSYMSSFGNEEQSLGKYYTILIHACIRILFI